MDVLNFLVSLALFIWFASALFWGLATAALAATFRLSKAWLWSLLGAAVPLIGLLICLFVGLAKRIPGQRASKLVNAFTYKLWFAFACLGVIVALIVSLFLPWFVVEDGGGPIWIVHGWSSGLDGWLWTTVITLAVCAILNIFWPNRFVAVALAWFGSWWLLYAVAALTSSAAFHEAVDGLFHVTDLILADADAPISVGSSHWTFGAGGVWALVAVIGIAQLAMSVWVLRVCDRRTKRAAPEVDFWGSNYSSEEVPPLI